jgi:hypothetical protein
MVRLDAPIQICECLVNGCRSPPRWYVCMPLRNLKWLTSMEARLGVGQKMLQLVTRMSTSHGRTPAERQTVVQNGGTEKGGSRNVSKRGCEDSSVKIKMSRACTYHQAGCQHSCLKGVLISDKAYSDKVYRKGT